MKLLSNIWVLAVLALLIFLGTLAYLALGASKVHPEKPQTNESAHVDGSAVAALWNTQTGHIKELTSELTKRTRELDLREGELDSLQERLADEMRELKELQNEIAQQQQTLDDMMLSIEASEVKNLRSQATVYSNMDPEDTVKVFKTMNDLEVAKILYFMNSDVQSGIFAALVAEPAPIMDASGGTGMTGAEKVARLNELLKYAQPPEKKTGAF